MDQLVLTLEERIRSWRHLHAQGDENRTREAANSVYRTLFTDDRFLEIWDETVLTQLTRFLDTAPPEQTKFGERARQILERSSLVTSINDFFYGISRLDHARTIAALGRLIGDAGEPHAELMAEALGGPGSPPPFSKIEAVVDSLADIVDDELEVAMRNCLTALSKRGPTGVANAMLVRKDLDVGTVIRVTAVASPGQGQIQTLVPADSVFISAIDRAKKALQSGGYLGHSSDIVVGLDVTDAEYVGNSIALAAALAIMSSERGQPLAPHLAFTGDLNLDGQNWVISPVGGIASKLSAAAAAGCRRALIPAGNADEVGSDLRARIEIVPIPDLKAAFQELLPPRAEVAVQGLSERKAALLRSTATQKGWHLAEPREIQGGRQFTISPPIGNAIKVNIYASGSHSPKEAPDHRLRPVFDALRQMDGPSLEPRPVQNVFNVADSDLRGRIRAGLFELGPSEEKHDQYCDYVYIFKSGSESLAVKQYSSGKLQIQGRAGELFRGVLEVIFSQYNLEYPQAQLQVDDYLKHALEKAPTTERATGVAVMDGIVFPHIGTDESGKGDYFGPLVVAAVWVDERNEALLKALGVRDSKALSDGACLKLADDIRKICLDGAEVVEIPPETYNSLYEQFKNEGKSLNDLLAWGHARALESLLARHPAQYAIADQFGNERYIQSKLMEKGRRLRLVQTPKAERYIAVATASILARAQFLTRLAQLQGRAGVALPKGASNAVVEAARSIVASGGPGNLRAVAKLHFKTTDTVIDQRVGQR
jgi:ribonuclease HIII